MTHTLPRAILLLSATVFAGFGLAFSLFSERMAATIDIALPTDVARTDFMATYGGFELGVALFLFRCWRNPAWVRVGLIASGCAIGGFASLRLAGMLTSSSFSPLMLVVLIVESIGSAVSFWGARQLVVEGEADGR